MQISTDKNNNVPLPLLEQMDIPSLLDYEEWLYALRLMEEAHNKDEAIRAKQNKG